MAGPWEKYQTAPPVAATVPDAEAGPWMKYAAATPPPAAAAPDVGTLEGLGAGFVRGVRDVIDKPAQLLASTFSTKEGERVAALNKTGKTDFDKAYSDSTAADVGRIAGQVVIAAPAGAALGAGVRASAAASAAPRVAALGRAIETGGLSADGAGLATRVAGGAIGGAATTALVNPDDAATGAAIGAAVPVAARGLGAVGLRIGRAAAGPEVPAGVREAAAAGADAGYVVPPTQVRPTVGNRFLEGVAGKLTTAQNASAKNQRITNELAKQAIGATDLTPEGLATVRSQANRAYDVLGQSAPFQADDAFRNALDRAAGGSKQMAKDFPELRNSEVDTLLGGLAERPEFGAQSTIEAIKQLRFSGSGNKAAQDPAKRALGGVQMKVAAALEDLIDRNLEKAGAQDLLSNYRNARTILARTYDVEKALNPSSGNVDAAKLAQLLKKGRPLTGELKQAAEFGGAFPKAVQTPERMGSLPQTSPLDWAAAAGIGAATGGSPLAAAGLIGRPIARAAALSQTVQSGLKKPPTVDGPRLGLSARSRELPPAVALGLPVGLSNRDR